MFCMHGEGMMSVPAMVFLSVGIVSGISLIGAFTLSLSPALLKRGLLVMISFAAGALLGDSFLHLIPEIAESEAGFTVQASMALLGGVIAFFILEKILHWHHSHVPSEDVLHPVAITNLLGDALHNFLDGAIIAGSFLVSTKIGVATAIAVALHEIPQELGDFGIMVHAGLAPRKALALNFATALTAVLGAALTLYASSVLNGVEAVLIPATAGGFVYIASTDLIPELHKEPETGKSILQIAGLLAGVGVMAALLVLE